MPIAKMSSMPNSYHYTVLCLDSYEHKCMKGRIFHPIFEEENSFGSTMELLSSIDTMLNRISYPMASVENREFQRTSRVSMSLMKQLDAAHYNKERRGRLQTFLVRICFRQNASWQGTVKWLEGEKELKFRSALELLFMMDNVLIGSQGWKLDNELEETGL